MPAPLRCSRREGVILVCLLKANAYFAILAVLS